jgi:esterase/lipase
MHALGQVLQHHGIRVLRVTLQGHGCHSLEELRHTTLADWFDDLWRAYCLAATYAQRHALPLYYVGYSLGGSLVIDALQQPWAATMHFDRMVLFAPSITLPPLISAVLSPLGWLTRLPWVARLAPRSRNIPEYTCYPRTPLSAYAAQRQVVQHILRSGLAGLDRIPTIVFIDPEDELVDVRGIRHLIRQATLHRWEVVEVTNAQASLPGKHHHLIIDAMAVGEHQWQTIVERMLTHCEG